jgi:hypothetical protein
MTTPHQTSTPHPAAALLPWYLTGTLKESEHQAVDRHLADCAECRAELERLAQLRTPLQAAWSEEPMPELHVKQAVMAKIAADDKNSSKNAGGSVEGANMEQWFRNLFAPRWMPALAATLLVGQLALLLWTAGPQDRSSQDIVSARGIPPASLQVMIRFQESAPEARIRAVILNLKGRLVDGPTADGAYKIAVPLSNSEQLDTALERLRQQPDLIRSAERVLQ